MPSSPDFVAHALDLLADVGPVTARPMFGGHGVFHRGLMFALLDDDELFLKADDAASPRFRAAGSRQWTYPGPRGPMPMGYWRPPDEAHESAEAMRPWALLAIEAALRKAAAKAARRPAVSKGARTTGAKQAARKAAPERPAARKVAGRPARQSRK